MVGRKTALVVSLVALAGCVKEGLDPSTLPAEVSDDYAVFAQRCSKCHALERALHANVQDMSAWELYVARMRRQPGSGIRAEDTAPVLRFLAYHMKTKQKATAPAGDGGAR